MKRLLIFLSLSLFLCAGLAWSYRSAVQAQIRPPMARGCCDQLSASGEGIAGGPDSFVVDADFYIKGPNFGGPFGGRNFKVRSTARLISQSAPTADGTINALTSHVWEVNDRSDGDGVCEEGEDCILTLDRAALIPTATPGLMKLRSVIAMSDGKGRFEGACGKVDGTTGEGEINFAAMPPTVKWSFKDGFICQCH